ncbi:MAG: hypothetical protein ACP5D2_03650 [Candidatus Nanoarchaeia archaeon]
MKKTKLFLLLSLTFILLLLSISNHQTITGTITSIKYQQSRITITLNNSNLTYIIFTNQILNLKQGQTITIKGYEEEYKNKKQIIVNKIITSFS